jgi:ribosome biogenesis protein MAK21
MQGPLNTEAFWKKKAEDVAVDEVFFHKYFSQIGKGKQAAKKKASKAADGSENGEDENEDEIWDALVNSRPEVEGPSDDDSDMEMLDLDESDAELSDGDEEVEINMDDDEENDQEAEGLGMVDTDDDEDEDEDDDEGGVVLDEGSDGDSDMDKLFAKELQTAKESVPQEGKETSRQKKKKLKGLPTFASVDDYASMLDNDEDEDF